MKPKFPEVEVRMVGEDGNAFSIISRVSLALRRAKHGNRVKEFQDEATSGDYNQLLLTVMKWVSVR